MTSPPTPFIETPVKFPTCQSDSKAQSNTSIVPLNITATILPSIVQENSLNLQSTLSPTTTDNEAIQKVVNKSPFLSNKKKIIETPIIQYRDLLSEFGISDSEHSEDDKSKNKNNDNSCLLDSDYDEPKDMILSCTESKLKCESSPDNLCKIGKCHKEYEATSSDYEEPIDNNSSSINSIKLENRKSSSLPTDLGFIKKNNEPKISLDLKLQLSDQMLKFDNNLNAKLPPRQFNGRRENWSPMSLKRRRLPYGKIQKILGLTEDNSVDPDYDDVFIENENNHDIIIRSKSLDGNGPKSAPVTPTDEKRKLSFTKILRKRHTPIYRDSIHEAVLVRVSSLPDEDLLESTSSERLNDEKIQKTINIEMPLRSRAISPLTLNCDVTAKRLSESDKDVNQISPVKLKTFTKLIKQNDASVVCNLPINGKNLSDTSIESGKSDNGKIIDIDDDDHHDSGNASVN